MIDTLRDEMSVWCINIQHHNVGLVKDPDCTHDQSSSL